VGEIWKFIRPRVEKKKAVSQKIKRRFFDAIETAAARTYWGI
jgi:hypothetical protein